MSVFSEIRTACAEVERRAVWVRIEKRGLAGVADRLAGEARKAIEDPAHLQLHTSYETLAFVVILDALNFGSGWFPALRKPDGRSGYFTIANALREFVEAEGVPEPRDLLSFSEVRCAELFGQAGNAAVAPLMRLFSQSLADLGKLVVEKFEGRFDVLVKQARGNAAQLVEILASMPLYRDIARYGALAVPFFKRAQITCSDLALALDGDPLGTFRDIDELTLFADNLVPHVLRYEGALVYDRGLAERIDRGELLSAGSPEEVEIRAVAVVAVECLVELLGDRGRVATARWLDGRLWSWGHEGDRKSVPRHRTQCPYY